MLFAGNVTMYANRSCDMAAHVELSGGIYSSILYPECFPLRQHDTKVHIHYHLKWYTCLRNQATISVVHYVSCIVTIII